LTAQVDYFGGISDVSSDIGGAAYRDDSITDGCDRLCGGILIIDGDHIAISQHQICDRVRWFCVGRPSTSDERRCASDQKRETHNSSPFQVQSAL
jgi:hypothetical protein